MTSSQLNKIRKFAKKFYGKTGKFHTWDHILLTRKYALRLAKKNKTINNYALEAACYLHDIGRVKSDEGHPIHSVALAKPFLEKVGLDKDEVMIISDSVLHHDKDQILKSKSIEARILFDADKLQILSVFGFIRVLLWLVDERKMEMNKAVDFLWKYCKEVRKKYLFTQEAKRIVDKDFVILNKVLDSFINWQT